MHLSEPGFRDVGMAWMIGAIEESAGWLFAAGYSCMILA